MQGLYNHIKQVMESHDTHIMVNGEVFFNRSFHINLRGEVLLYNPDNDFNNESLLEDRGDNLVKINGLPPIIQLDMHYLSDGFTIIMVTTDHQLMLLSGSHDAEILETEKVKFIKDICSACYVVDMNDNLRCIDWVKYELTPVRLNNVRWIERSDINLSRPIFVTHDNRIVTGEHNMFEKNHLSTFKVGGEINSISRNAILSDDKVILLVLRENGEHVLRFWTRLDHRPVHIDYRNEILHTIDSEGILRSIDQDHLIDPITKEGRYRRFIPYKYITYIEDVAGNLHDLNTLKIIPFSDQLMDVNKFKKPTKSSSTRI